MYNKWCVSPGSEPGDSEQKVKPDSPPPSTPPEMEEEGCDESKKGARCLAAVAGQQYEVVDLTSPAPAKRRCERMSPEGVGTAPLAALPAPSAEQQAVIDALFEGNCVSVPSVAGSGKTTCMLQVALQMPDRDLTILTYNRALKEDCTARIRRLGMSRVHCFTIHALTSKLAGELCNNDTRLLSIVESWETGQSHPKPMAFDLVLLDEAQGEPAQRFPSSVACTNIYYMYLNVFI